MSYLTSYLLPSLQTLKYLEKVESFESWLKQSHPDVDEKELFPGYLFCIQCSMSTFFDALAYDELLKFKTDNTLSFAMKECIPLRKLQNESEKIILLKNLHTEVKMVTKSKSFNEIQIRLNRFNNRVTKLFDDFFDLYVYLTPKAISDKQAILKLDVIEFVHTHMTQISNIQAPIAYTGTLTDTYFPSKYQLNEGFMGYKYALQYLWHELLPADIYNGSSLINLHTADSWRTYIYESSETPYTEEHDFFSRKQYILEKQTSLDSYYFRAYKEVVPLLESQHYENSDKYYIIKTKAYNRKEHFKDFLGSSQLKDPFDDLTWKEKVTSRLYWQALQVIEGDKTGMHVGIPTFNIMLAGSIALLDSDSEVKKIVVAKFTHPHTGNTVKNDYSYGIYIDSQATGRNYCGWVVYLNACGDYSGFSGSEFKSAETLIKKYKKANKIELRELTIPIEEFEKVMAPNIKSAKELRNLSANQQVQDVLSRARGHLFELFIYWVHTTKQNDYKVHLNVDKGKSEKDIVLTKDDEVKIIECKLNPKNQNLKEVKDKLDKKLEDYSGRQVSYELWFWENVSEQSRQFLEKNKISFVEVQLRKHKHLEGIDLSVLNHVMKDVSNIQFDLENFS